MQPANHRKKSKLIDQIKLAFVIALLFWLVGYVGHMDLQDEQIKAELSGTK